MTTSWAATAENPGASAAVPVGSDRVHGQTGIDVFYIHPTTYRTTTHWNQDVADAQTNAWTDMSVLARQASVFNDCCRVFAPRYRQASFLATRDRNLGGDGGLAYELAFSDIDRAFEYYIDHFNEGRPFILVGHSQGALMGYWLVRDKIDGSDLEDRLVAAYLPGLDLLEGDFGRTFNSVPLCERPAQTGCILAWNAVNRETDLGLMGRLVGGRYTRVYGTEDGRKAVCVNPLTFDVGKPSADYSASRGALVGVPAEAPLEALLPGSVSARCEEGFLVVDYDEALGIEPLPGGSLHYHDISLFYADIRFNLRERIEAFLEKSFEAAPRPTASLVREQD